MKKCMRRIIIVGLATVAVSAYAEVRYGEHNLADFAKKNAQGAINVIYRAGEEPGSDEVWGSSYPAKAFDGNIHTCFDPCHAYHDTYVGYDLTATCHLTRVRFHGRLAADGSDGPTRICHCSVTGIEKDGESYTNTPDLFLTKNIAPSNWRTSAPRFFEVVPTSATRAKKYIGFRFGERLSWGYNGDRTFCGSVAEVEFYGMTDESYKAFDGDRSTVLALSSGDTIERNFGSSVPIAEVRVVYSSSTAVGDTIQISEDNDFSSATNVFTVSAAPTVGTVVTYQLHDVSGKCVRYVSKAGGQIAEIEFLTAPEATDVTFTRKLTSSYDQYYSMSATLPPFGNGGATKVYRGPGRGGPWTEVATFVDTQTNGVSFSLGDTGQTAGSVNYYRFAKVFSFDGGEVEAADTAIVQAPILGRHLERTSSDLTKLASGCSIIANCGQKCWSPSTSTDWNAITNSMKLAFDNNLITQTDIQKKQPHTALGVDFGEPCYFTNFRLYFTSNNSNSNRINNVKFAGSNLGDWVTDGNFTVLTEDFMREKAPQWYARDSICDTPFRYCFAYNSRDNEWGCLVAELQYFGYRSSETENISVGVENVRYSVDGSANVTLAWDAARYGGAYTVQRKTGDGDWASVASALSATTFTDSGLTFDGNVYSYRVVTVKGSGDPAYSETVQVQMYERGNGTGLYAQITAPFVSTNVNPNSTVTVLPAATVDGVNLSSYASGVLAKWSGRLVVPVAGTYYFDADSDEHVAVWVNGKAVHYLGTSGGVAQRALNLAAGEYDIVVTAYRNDAGANAALYWSGPVVREAIPATQLKPVAPEPAPEGWSSMRSFAPDAETYYPADYVVDSDGKVTAALGAPDLWSSNNGYSYLYRAVTNDFVFSARVDWYGGGFNSNRKAGIMLRSSLKASAPFEGYLIQLHPSLADNVQVGGKSRTSEGAGIVDVWTIGATKSWQLQCPSGGCYFRVCRTGSNVKVYVRDTRSDPWTLAFDRTLGSAYGETIYVGLALAGAGSSIGIPDFSATFSDYKFGLNGLYLLFY